MTRAQKFHLATIYINHATRGWETVETTRAIVRGRALSDYSIKLSDEDMGAIVAYAAGIVRQ